MLYQAFVVDRLMGIFEAPLFFGLPEEGPLTYVRPLAEHFHGKLFLSLSSWMVAKLFITAPSPNFAQWRSLTVSMIDQDHDGIIATHTKSLLDAIQVDIITTLSELTANTTTSSQQTALQIILENTMKAARVACKQHARFIFELPKVSAEREVTFDGKVMEDVNGEDEDELKGRKIQCATFPALYKVGDERGDNVHLKNVIFKARVLCAQPEG